MPTRHHSGGTRRTTEPSTRRSADSAADWPVIAAAASATVLGGLQVALGSGAGTGGGLGVVPFVLVGMAAVGDETVEELTAKISAFLDGEDVAFGSDRDDAVGDLYEAVGELADGARDRPAVEGERERESEVEDEGESERDRRELYRITSAQDLDHDEKIDRVLELGCDCLGLACGLVTRIDEESGRYEVERVAGGDLDTAGTVADLSSTFCRRTITADEVLGIYDAAGEAPVDRGGEGSAGRGPGTDGENDAASADGDRDGSHGEWGIGSYVGEKLEVDGELWGTLCFVDEESRERPFTHEERLFVDLASRWVSDAIERTQHLERLERDRSLLDSIFEQLPVHLFVKDREARHVRVSSAYIEQAYGVDESHFLGKTDPEVFDEELAAESYADDRSVIETGEPVLNKQVHIPDIDAWALSTKVPWRGEDGEIRGLIGISQRVTDLVERERQLAAIVENTTTPIYIKGDDGTYQFVNEAAADLFGLDPERMVGRTDAELFDPDALGDIRAGDRRVLETGESLTAETVTTIDGEERVFLDNKYPYRDENGELLGVMGISRDITDRKSRERELRQTKERLEAIVEASPDALVAVDLDGTVELWNPAAERIFGWDAEEVLGDLLPFVPEDRTDEFEDLDETLRRGESVTGLETERLRRDGTRIDVGLSIAPLRSSEGEVVGKMGVLEDTSERKRQEKQLRETKERLGQFIETSPVGVVATDRDGLVTLWNDGMEEIFGWSREEVRGEEYPAVPDDSEAAVRQRVLAGESVSQVELERVRKDGQRIDITLSAGPIYDDDGEVVELVGYIQDVTERKSRERKLEERSVAIERSIDGVAILDEDGVYKFVNQAHADIYGYDDPGVFVGESWELCYTGAELERIRTEVVAELDETGSWRGEAVGTRADGSTFPQEVSVTALESGGMVCVVRDVTDRKERERELRRTSSMLQQTQRVAAVGGWEVDLTTDPPAMTWTDELYWLHDLPPGTDVDLETAVRCYHPEDRDEIRQLFEHAVSTGEPYDMEVRLQTAEGAKRWVRAIGEPVTEDDETVAVRGSIQDITDRKERELALESLHRTTQGLLGTETEETVADLVVRSAASVLDTEGVGVFLLDEGANRLEPAAHTERFEALCETVTPVVASESDSLLWESFVTGTVLAADDDRLDREMFGEACRSALVVPVGNHGVFVVATGGESVSDRTRRLAETLVATTETALDRIESEATLRERDAELESQNRRLKRQIQVTDIIRRIDRSLIRAGSRAEVESAVCEGLVDAEDVAFAWVGSVNPSGERLEPRAWAGTGGEYLDAVSLSTGDPAPEPAVAAADTGEATVVSNVLADLKREPWRKQALAADFQSALSVPLTYEGYVYGVLTVYADQPAAFGDLERDVFEELGTNIANTINAVETHQALHADRLVELRLRLDDDDSFLGRLAREADCAVSYEGLAASSDEEARLFFRATGAAPEAVDAVLEDLVSVATFRRISESERSVLYEVTVTGETIPSRLVRHGATPRSVEVADGETEVVLDIPTTTDVREFVEMLREAFPSVELVARRTTERTAQTKQELAASLFAGLTDRQLEVLRTAYFAGFFEWPRESTGEDVAEMLGVTQPTVNRHLRLSQRHLLEQLFEDAASTVVVE